MGSVRRSNYLYLGSSLRCNRNHEKSEKNKKEKVRGDSGMYGFIPLVDMETGEECEFEVLEILHHEDHVYYVLLNTEIPTDEVVILEVVVDEDDEDEE